MYSKIKLGRILFGLGLGSVVGICIAGEDAIYNLKLVIILAILAMFVGLTIVFAENNRIKLQEIQGLTNSNRTMICPCCGVEIANHYKECPKCHVTLKEENTTTKRTEIKLKCTDVNQADMCIKQILYRNNFKETIVNGETVYKKDVLFLGGQCLKIEYNEKQIVISAFITPFFGGTEEYSLEGFSAIIPKRQLISVLEQIVIALR